MVLTVDSWNIADARIQGIALHPLVGAYELRFGLMINVSAVADGEDRRAVIDGARVQVATGGGRHDELGFARADRRLEIVTRPHPDRMTPTLSLALQPGQLGAIEDLRGTGDFRFELEVTGTGASRAGVVPVHDVLRCEVPRSEWIEKLRAARARDILLLEVPVPFPERSDRWAKIAEEVARAESRFRDGDYHACVAACRMVVEELGHRMFARTDWAGPSLDRFQSKRREMSKGEREAAILAALHHYTHQSHHGESAGGETR